MDRPPRANPDLMVGASFGAARRGLRRAGVVTWIALLGLVGVACSGAKDTGFPAPGESPTRPASPATGASPRGGAATDVEVKVGDIFFEPKEITVKAGAKVIWEHVGTQPHSVTADDGSFDSHPSCPSGACMQGGDTFEHVFAKPGRFPYYCRVHGGRGGIGQSGVITVEP